MPYLGRAPLRWAEAREARRLNACKPSATLARRNGVRRRN
jgi:hypothetical protein